MKLQEGDTNVYISNLAGEVYAWDMSASTLFQVANTGVELTDIAIAPDGQMLDRKSVV